MGRQTLRGLAVAAAAAVSCALSVLFAAEDRTPPPAATDGPRNIIVMIGDGRGYNHVRAANLYQTGRPRGQVYESFPVRIGCTTYSLTGKGYDPDSAWTTFEYLAAAPTDSAAAATALATGKKTYNGAIGVVPTEGVDPKSAQPVENVLERAESRGKATGVVTSVPLSHATPAGFVAHSTARGEYAEIARQMIEESACEVIMGCGHPLYDDGGRVRREGPESDDYRYVGGSEVWERLRAGVAGGDADGDGTADPWTLIESRGAFRKLMVGPTPERVVGVARSASTLQQERPGDRTADPYVVPLTPGMPTLVEMSLGALNVLDNDPDGFVLMIEGGAIDWAGHGNQLGRAIEETLAFGETVQAVVDWVESHGGWDENLVIVTADHETGYLTGPGSGPGEDGVPVWNPLISYGAGKAPGAEWHSKGHSNSLVPLDAKGAGSERLRARATGRDERVGAYADNTDIANTIFDLLR